jgi:hypothetical protein
MSKQINDEGLEKLILDTVKKINIEHAAHTEPVYSLAEILTLKNVTELREFAKTLQVKNYSKLRKPELICSIAKIMQNLDILRDCLYTVNEIEWDFFQEAAARKYLQTDKVYFNTYHVLQKMGLLQSFYHDDKLFYVVPDKIKAAYKELAKTDFPEDKRFRDLINDYAIAAVSLYGVISQDDFVELFNSQNVRQTSVDEVFPLLLNNIYADVGYCLWDEYIVDDEFEEEDFAAVPWVLAERKEKPPYTPSREELLKYSDWDYYELTPQLIALKSCLSELIADPDEVEDLLYEIHDMSVAGVRIQEYFDLLDSAGIVFDGLKQAKKMMLLIVDVQNNTRQWTNYGHTPNELHPSDKSNLLPFPSDQPVHSQKFARNAPCPCGSGKKYKKCCGRVNPA